MADEARRRRNEERFKTVLQVLAILMLVGMVGMVFHKAFHDVGAIADQHSGADFWKAVVRMVFKNLAG